MHRVPLRDVIGAAQAVLQTARLKVAHALELAETLVSDLQAFDPKPIERNSNLRGDQQPFAPARRPCATHIGGAHENPQKSTIFDPFS